MNCSCMPDYEIPKVLSGCVPACRRLRQVWRRRRRGNVATMPTMMLQWALAATALLGTAIAAAPRPHFVFLLIDGELVCVSSYGVTLC